MKVKTKIVDCNQCLHPTRHEVIAQRKLEEPEFTTDGEYLCDCITTYTMLQCRGCDSVVLEKNVFLNGPDTDSTEYYPPPVSRRTPSWLIELPRDFQELMLEIYGALHADSVRLALMGARTLVDMFMNKTLGDIGGFKEKLSKLVEDGYLSEKNKDVLDIALDAGHAVIHRGYKPGKKDVNLVIDIVENLIQTLVLSNKIKALKRRTPVRKNRRTER